MIIEIIQEVTKVVELQQAPPVVINVDVIESEFRPIDIVHETIQLTQNRQEGLIIREVPCENIVYIGAAVVMQNSGIAKLAIATSYENSNVIGIVETKTAQDRCDIRFMGVSAKIFSNLNVGEEYYLSDSIPGLIVPTPQAPLTSGHVRIKLGQPFSSSEFVFIKGERIIKG